MRGSGLQPAQSGNYLCGLKVVVSGATEAADVLEPPGKKVPGVAGLTYLLMSYPDSALKREIRMVKKSPHIDPTNPQSSLLPPRCPTIGGSMTGSLPLTPSLYSQMQKSKTVNVHSMAARSPGLFRVMGPLVVNVSFKSGRALPLSSGEI